MDSSHNTHTHTQMVSMCGDGCVNYLDGGDEVPVYANIKYHVLLLKDIQLCMSVISR